MPRVLPVMAELNHERRRPLFSRDGDKSGRRQTCHRAPGHVVETVIAARRRRGGRVSSGLRVRAAQFFHGHLSLLLVPACLPADAAPGVLLRAEHRLRGLCAAPGVFLDGFWLARDRALDRAGVLARIVRRARAVVSAEVRQTRGPVGSVCVDGDRIFPQ